jgi:transposase
LFLYDVTSSYLEGICNELGRFGYNRDGKKGKMQIVVGLLAGPDGLPVAVRVFEGNTNDTKTVSEQVRILAESFGVKEVTLVGDRGMLKGPQIAALPDDFRFITAITKPQIVKMLSQGRLQIELFTDRVCEVVVDEIRYVLRRNPVRAAQMGESRESKLAEILKAAEAQTKHLAAHSRATANKALNKVTEKIKRLKSDGWLGATAADRKITVAKDDAALANVALLDGCYVIKSDIPKTNADTQTLHDRYCDLENVERAFRTMKTAHLDLRPVYVHKKVSTKGHVFVVMLALLLQRELERCWTALDLTVEEGIDELGAIQTEQIRLGGVTINHIPKPNDRAAKILEKASVVLPTALPQIQARVHTKKMLSSERKRD